MKIFKLISVKCQNCLNDLLEIELYVLILGPLTFTDGLPAREFIVGVVSWGANCGKAQYPGVYARVTHVRDWIDEQMAIKC